MLSALIFLPLAAAAVLLGRRGMPAPVARWVFVAVTAVEAVLVAAIWVGYDGPGVAFETNVA